ncbi:MAG: LURP-one-related family protein [Gemmatimonadaceae bacterium]
MTQLKLRQRLLSIGEDYDVTDAAGKPRYKVDGKVLRIRETFVIENTEGQEVGTVKQKLVALRRTMIVTRGGREIATIRKALIAPFRDKWMIDVEDGKDLTATGNILDHEYTVRRDDDTIATISKRWFTIRDTYGVDIRDGEDEALIVAIVVAIDEMVHDPDEEERDKK